MKRIYLCCVFICLSASIAIAQKDHSWKFRAGALFDIATKSIANNVNGIGGLLGVEWKMHSVLSAEAELSYSYFFGDKVLYENASNTAYAVPLLLGLKTTVFPGFYISPRAGAVLFQFNGMNENIFKFSYGAASGFNFPRKHPFLNAQLSVTSFRYQQINRGYATLAFSILIN